MKKIYFLLIVLTLVLNCGIKRSSVTQSLDSISKTYTFPKTFLWGTATAAEQMEATPESNWGKFIQDALGGGRFETLAKGEAKPGHINNLGSYPEHVILKKTDHNRMFREDVRLMKEMNQNSYRFSIGWDKLFPKEDMNEPDPEAIQFYKDLLDELKKNSIKPSVTLFHFSTPAWFWNEKDGKKGWERSDALDHFTKFVKVVVLNFGKDVTHWCTLNEPMVFLYAGYMEGVHPPLERRKDVSEIAPIFGVLLKAHTAAYQIIKENDKALGQTSEVGFTQHTRAFEPYRNYAILDRMVSEKIEEAFIWNLLDAVKTGTLEVANTSYKETIPGLKGSMDYVGINYYGRYYVKANIFSPSKFKVLMNDPDDKNEVVNELAWAHYPLGFSYIVKKAYQKYNLPIYILENGTAEGKQDDKMRQQLLVTHLFELANLLDKKEADIRGYYHWSLIDNFEWAEGFEAKFGLVEVDYKDNFKRIKRNSADLYSKIISEGINPELYNKFRMPK